MNTMIIVASLIVATFVGTPLPPQNVTGEELVEEISVDNFKLNQSSEGLNEIHMISKNIEDHLNENLEIDSKEIDSNFIKSLVSLELLDEVKYASENIILRKGPNIESTKLTDIEKAEELKVLYDMKNDWYLAQYEDYTGFVDKNYLSSEKTVEETEPEKLEKPEPEVESNVQAKTFKLSFYTNLPEHNGGYTITASGDPLTYGVVASNVYPLGTKIELEGYGMMTVLDRGGSHFNNDDRLDVFIPPKKGESKKSYTARIWKLGRKVAEGKIHYPTS